jgi:pilus assembly protein CpaF
MALLHLAVVAGLNILVIGRTGVGKTALLSMLGSLIPYDRRVLVIEDTRELDLRPGSRPQNCVYLTSVVKRGESSTEVDFAQLVRTALRQRPDALVMGESRGAELAELLKAMQTGHGGMLTSIHANGVDDLLNRAEDMLLEGGIDRTPRQINNLLSTSFHIAVHLLLDHNGRRIVNEISAFKGRLPDSAPGDVPYHEKLFLGGAERNYRLALVRQESVLEAELGLIGHSFQEIVEIYQQEQGVLSTHAAERE